MVRRSLSIASASILPTLSDSIGAFHFVPGCSLKRSHTNATINERELDIQLCHNDLQLALYEHLIDKYGAEAVGTERGNGAGVRIDVVVKANDCYSFFEIKIGLSARACIREELAQLLEYSLWPGALEAESLLIVGEPPLDSKAATFLRKLRDKFAIPVRYQQFDFQQRRLVE